jgi:hypothetical protein
MRLQRRLKSYFSDDQTLYSRTTTQAQPIRSTFSRASSADRRIGLQSKPKSLRHVEQIPFNVARNVLANYNIQGLTEPGRRFKDVEVPGSSRQVIAN